MAGLIGMTTRYDPVPGTKQLTMSDERDFARPRPPLMQQDINFISDEDLQRIREVFPDYKPLLEEEPEPKEKAEPETKPDPNIKIFQSFFGSPLPIVGSLYRGPIDGIYNNDLGNAAKAVEAAVSKATGASATGLVFNGATKTFNTSPEDISAALELLSNRNLEKSAAIKQRIDFFKKIISS